MNGIINVLKPPGMTSHDVVYSIRKVLNTRKVGHTGTLDPEAAGVLPVCIGKATKVVQFLTDNKKSYRANIKFGAVTDTYDGYGRLIRECGPVTINSNAVEEALKSFRGTISQKPPIYSALKIKGKKLYEYAREGKEVEIAERPVEIYELKLVGMISPDEAMIDVLCSKGTYVRTLCYDIGEAMGCGAYMSQLVRLGSQPFDIKDSHTLEEIRAAASENRLADIIDSVELLFKERKAIVIKQSALSSVLNGNPLFEQGVLKGFDAVNENDDISLYSEDGFLGIGLVKFDADRQRLYIKATNIFV